MKDIDIIERLDNKIGYLQDMPRYDVHTNIDVMKWRLKKFINDLPEVSVETIAVLEVVDTVLHSCVEHLNEKKDKV